jgi:hypothetical protein
MQATLNHYSSMLGAAASNAFQDCSDRHPSISNQLIELNSVLTAPPNHLGLARSRHLRRRITPNSF